MSEDEAQTGPSVAAITLCRRVLFLLVAGFASGYAARAQQPSLDADVVVLSDTSASMRENDPQNAVVLMSRLFADIVPGKLTVVRLFDTNQDKDRVPMRSTGKTVTCEGGGPCTLYEFAPGAREKVVEQRILASVRPARGDAGYKMGLTGFLRAAANNTAYQMSLETVGKVFRDNASPEGVPRVMVWLSDGATDDPDWDNGAKPALQDVMNLGVLVRALVFKSGKTERVKASGLEPIPVADGSPRQLMFAFADAFRQIVQAPFRIDDSVSHNPNFVIKPHMEDVWVVIYGDESLSSASISGNGRTVQADYASDHYNGSAYRVVYMNNPPDGNWKVSAVGGGNDVSYAVVQRSTITPVATAPPNVFTGVPFKLDVVLKAGAAGQELLPSDLPEAVTIEAEVDGVTVPLHDDGKDGDEKPGDGHYTSMITAHKSGPLVINVRAHSSFLDRTVKITVNSSGFFRYTGGPIDIDFGSLKAGKTVCMPLVFQAEQEGAIPFELRSVATFPAHLDFELRSDGKHTAVGGPPLPMLPYAARQICLVTGRDADSSQSHAQSWVSLAVNGRLEPETIVPMRFTWSVQALTFWEKWGWLILLILLGLLVTIIIYGYIKPYRFPSGLSLCFAPAIDELDDQTPQPVRMWKGTGIGFYRDARACLHDTFRINGKVKGAVSILQAGPRRAVIVKPGSRTLYREVGVGEWDQVPQTGRRAGQGEIYRAGESGPFFRLSMRMSS